LLGPDEDRPRGRSGRRESLLEDTAAYWQEWVRSSRFRSSGRMRSIRGRHHLEAQRVRDTGAIIAAVTTVDSRGTRGAGATGTTATAGCATPISWINGPQSAERHADDGALPDLHLGTSSPTGKPGVSSPRMGSAGTRSPTNRNGFPPRVPRPWGRSDRESGVPAGPARCLRLGHPGRHPCVLPTAGDCSGEMRSCPSARSTRGPRGAKLFDQPDAGIWELRGAARVPRRRA